MIKYKLNKSNESDINTHLQNSKEQFVPALDTYVDISEYVVKLRLKSNTFEAWNGTNLIGLVAVYSDALSQTAYITNVSIVKDFMRQGIAKTLINKCKIFYKSKAYLAISLEVFKSNKLAIDFYQKQKFYTKITRKETIIMTAEINRNYNKEFKDNDRKYFYGFDLDVMHPFMLKAFTPFFKEGSMLELGSFKGEFTKRLLPHFTDITCVEASDEAVLEAKGSLGGKVQIHNSLFENLTLSRKFDNIVLTHVLEHIDSPVALLKKINDEWLSDTGRFFLVCPNANAPSRQIAVKMGLISHNSAVTPAENEHGHQITYTLDTLERDAKAAGLKVVHRSGIFFKALANFQWDKILGTDVISPEYLEGCYELGQQYPDLCSSIFLMCEKGDIKD